MNNTSDDAKYEHNGDGDSDANDINIYDNTTKMMIFDCFNKTHFEKYLKKEKKR